MDLLRVENELKKRWLYPYQWGRKQADNWDKKTNFIYKTYHFEKLLDRIKNEEDELKNYALNRWYNFWSAMAVEDIFSSHTMVTPSKDNFDKLKDFSIYNIPFDHKTSVFPKRFNNSLSATQKEEKELILWLYKNQSRQGRKHFKNRLFIVLYDFKAQEHWKLKAEIGLLEKAITNYLKNFSANKLYQLTIENNQLLSDIIWVCH